MIRVAAYNPLDDIPSADLNRWQDLTIGVRAPTVSGGVATNAFTPTYLGGDALGWQVTLATNTLYTLEGTTDWRDRWILAGQATWPGGTQGIGDSADYGLNDAWAGPYVTRLGGAYLGRGAYSNLGSGAAVGPGSPPLNGAGAFRSYAFMLTTHLSTSAALEKGPWVFCSPTTGYLQTFQNTGSPVRFLLSLTLSGPTGLRP